MQEESPKSTNDARAAATRAALIGAARALFATKGYAETSTPEIVAKAGVTRGALYHHFEDKAALFTAVVTEEYKAVARQIETAASHSNGSAIDALRHGSRAFINAMKDKGRVRIMLRDGPAVLGTVQLTTIDRETTADTLRKGLAEAMRAGAIKTLPLEALIKQLSALFDRAALAISEGDDPEEHVEVLDSLLTSLAPSG
jgi:AcrR family transcriptional regulator